MFDKSPLIYAKQSQLCSFFAQKKRFHEKQSQFKANSNPIKPKTNPIRRKAKSECFCVDKESYDCFNNATRGIYHPLKGANFYTIGSSY